MFAVAVLCFLVQIREGRFQRSKTVKSNNNPTFNEDFFMVVDDFVKQKLSIKVGCLSHANGCLGIKLLGDW